MPTYQASASAGAERGRPALERRALWQTGYCREVPDVSADAAPRTGYIVRAEEEWNVIGGTSAAAPLWAAFATLTNASPACGGKAIGFANPALYAIAGTAYAGNFGDVVTSRAGLPRTTNLFSESQPYAAGSLYDMATGLGTPSGRRSAPRSAVGRRPSNRRRAPRRQLRPSPGPAHLADRPDPQPHAAAPTQQASRRAAAPHPRARSTRRSDVCRRSASRCPPA